MMPLFRKKKTYYDKDDTRQELTPDQIELIEWFGVPLIGPKRGPLAATTWHTSRGKIEPQQLLPVECVDSEYLYAELRWHLDRVARNTDRALQIAKLLLAYNERGLRADKWMHQARELLRKVRGSSGEFIWAKSPPVADQSILYVRFRPGWEDVNSPTIETELAKQAKGMTL